MKHRIQLSRAATLPLLVALAGCAAGQKFGMNTASTLAPSAAFSGTVMAPQVIANNSAGLVVDNGIIANNSAGVIANNSAGVIANNSAGYRIASLAQATVSALVYLTDQREQFYTYNGQRIATTVDAQGHYALPAVLPRNLSVIVNAALPGNQRMVGYAYSTNGSNKVDVNLASTYAVELLRQQAAYRSVDMGTFDISQLPTLTTLTQQMLDAGTLGIPNLTTGYAAQIDNAYVSSFGTTSGNQGLSDLWAKVLGFRPIPITTYAGDGTLSTKGDGGAATSAGIQGPVGMATFGTSGSFVTYLMQQGGDEVRKIDAAGNITNVFKPFTGDPTVDSNSPALIDDGGITGGANNGEGSYFGGTATTGTGNPFANQPTPRIRLSVTDTAGNLIMSPDNNSQTDNHVLLVACNVSGTYYGRSMTAGNVYRLGAPHSSGYGTRRYTYGYQGDGNPVYPASSGTDNWARFRYIRGLTIDDQNNLYVADRYNNVVRRIDRGTGVVTTIAGVHQTPDSKFNLNPPGYPGNTFQGDGGAASAATFYWPDGLAYRRVNSTTEELYVVDSLNDRIRKVTATGGNWASGTVTTVAGNGTLGYSGDGGPATAAAINLGNPTNLDESGGGIALDAARGYLYFVDDDNFVVRMVDLNTGKIRTVAGTGANFPGHGIAPLNGEAIHIALDQPVSLAVAPDGTLLVSDLDNNTVRRVWTQWGF